MIVENLLSIPMNLPASRAVAASLAGRAAILHHHDPPWQRERFAHITELPPDDRAWAHVTINEPTGREMATRLRPERRLLGHADGHRRRRHRLADAHEDYVAVAAAPPVAAFVGTPTAGSAPLSVAFTSLSTGEIDEWTWSFGDGGTSSSEFPSHVYTSSGSYNVSLTVNGPGGSDTRVMNGYVTVSPAAPDARFSAAPAAGAAPLLVAFTDQTVGQVTSWSWDFGDGATSSMQNPTHSYAANGQYTVSLTVLGPSGVDTETRTDYVNVAGTTPIANFWARPPRAWSRSRSRSRTCPRATSRAGAGTSATATRQPPRTRPTPTRRPATTPCR